jgi:oligopeptide/dipeptide ABC transporter ATP-binding protein
VLEIRGRGPVVADVLLAVKDLTKYFPVRAGLIFDKQKALVKAVDGVSFQIENGRTFGLVGESGCGKTTIAKMLLLLESATSGDVLYKNKAVHNMQKIELNAYRSAIQAVFQDPYSSLSPRMKAGDIISEPMSTTGNYSKQEKKDRVKKLLQTVGLAPEAATMYPHEFSGGQRQRVAIARALSVNPRIIILDEPVSALDVSFQAQIINLLIDIQAETGITYLLISHDLAVVEHVADWIGVMYLGKIVETAPARDLYNYAQHPYTKALLAAVPVPDPEVEYRNDILGGEVPSPLHPPTGCGFHPRCARAGNICSKQVPELLEVSKGHEVACHFCD